MAKPAKDFYSKQGLGVYRRWTHHIPVKGGGAIQRRRVRAARSEITLKDDISTKVPIKTLRRVACEGFQGILVASQRPCCRAECQACCPKPDSGHFHDTMECSTSTYTTCKEIRLEPLSDVDPTPIGRGALAHEGSRLGALAAVGDFMAVETECDEMPWWLVLVTGKAQTVPNGYTCPNLHCDVEFEYPRLGQAVMVKRLRPAATGRGADSTRFFEVDTTLLPFLIPCHLIRVGKIKLLQQAASRVRLARACSSSNSSNAGAVQYELKAEIKSKIYERCRIWGTT